MIPVIRISRDIPVPPRRSGFARWFWEGLENGVFETTQCEGCGKVSFPPVKDCPRCGSQRYRFYELSGRGVLYSRTMVRMTPTSLIPLAPLSLGIVDLEEGVRVACALLDRKTPLKIGQQVQISTMKFNDGALFGAQSADDTIREPEK